MDNEIKYKVNTTDNHAGCFLMINKELIMNRLLAILLATTFSTMAVAETSAPVGPTVGGKVEVEIKENASNDWGAKTTFGLGFNHSDMAFGGISLEAVDSNTLTVDEWQMGTSLGMVTVSVGDQGDIWIGAEGEHTIANPKMDESVIADFGDAAIALEFGDWKNDVSDIEAIAGSYTTELNSFGITVAGDYDRVTENYTIGGRADMSGSGIALTYAEATETMAYELDSSQGPIAVYMNGNEGDMLQNIGGGYTWDIRGLDIEASANYDIDAEDISPSVKMAFSF